VRDRIECQPRWLLVLDNADDLAIFGAADSSESGVELLDLRKYVPNGANGTLLWTSRTERIVGTLVGVGRGIQVGRMTTDEAVCLLGQLKSSNGKVKSGEEINAKKLVRELECLPLAISQASAYMRRTSMSTQEYLSRLSGEDRSRVLSAEKFDRHQSGVPKSVLNTWSISVQRIRQTDELAYNMLHVIAYVNNQNIPIKILDAVNKLRNETENIRLHENQDRTMEAITQLKEFSFLSVHEEENVRQYEVHKLVQEATRYELSLKIARDAAYFSNAALQIVTRHFPSPRVGTWPVCEEYVTHAVEVSKWVEVSDSGMQASCLLAQVSLYLNQRGRWIEQLPLANRVYKLRQRVLGARHPDTLTSLAEIATSYNEQGRYTEARTIMIQALELRKQVLGDEHPSTLQSQSGLASIYYGQGLYAQAMPIIVQALELQKHVLGDRHPSTLQSQSVLVALYCQQRRPEAESMVVEALELQKQVLGEKHPSTLHSRSVLAAIYCQQRRPEAEPMIAQTLELQKQVLGDRHPSTLQTQALLVVLYHEQRRPEAEPMMALVLQLQKQVLGDRHPSTLHSQALLAKLYHEEGRPEAERMMALVLQLQKQVLGNKHPSTLHSQALLADLYYAQGQPEAEPMMFQALELRQKVLGSDDPLVVWISAHPAAINYAKDHSRCLELEAKRVQRPSHSDFLPYGSNISDARPLRQPRKSAQLDSE
jgi:tetratricopeptide (TPR) repeat protein